MATIFFLKSGNISASDYTRHLILMPKYIEILPDFRKKIVAILKIKDGYPMMLGKKCKHCFSGSVGRKVSKNVYFSKSSKILNETVT